MCSTGLVNQRSKRAGLLLIAVGLAVLLAVPSATAKNVTITGKLHAEGGDLVDQNSSISMTVVVKRGKPRKIKNVSVTYSYLCDDGTIIGTATAKFKKTIDVNWKPGISPDRVDFEHREKIPDGDDPGNTRDGERFIQGDVTKRGGKAWGYLFLTSDNYICVNDQSQFSAPLGAAPPRGKPPRPASLMVAPVAPFL